MGSVIVVIAVFWFGVPFRGDLILLYAGLFSGRLTCYAGPGAALADGVDRSGSHGRRGLDVAPSMDVRLYRE